MNAFIVSFPLSISISFSFFLLLFSNPSLPVSQKPGKVPALDTVKVVSGIKTQYLAIDAKRKTYTQYMPATSVEGLLYVGFYEGNVLKMINANVYSDAGKTETDQYVNGNNIVMIFAKVFEYESPLSVNPRTKMKGMTEQWFYFNNEVLVKWVSGGKVIPSGSEEFKKRAEQLKEELKKTKAQFSDFASLRKIR